MVAPAIIGAAVGAGSALLGGRKSAKEARKLREAELAAQKEFAQHGVRWRVEDAKAAGLHPLYALGAQVPSFSPSFTAGPDAGAGITAAGQDIGRAIAAGQTREEREMSQLSRQLLEKQIAETDARIGALNAEAFRNYNEGLASTAFPSESLGIVPEGQAPRVGVGMTEVVPTKTPTVSANNPGIGAGRPPLTREYMTPFGFPMLLPGETQGGAAEAFESVSESDTAMAIWLMANLAHYAPGWLKPFFTGEKREQIREYRRSRGHGGPRYRTGGGF